MSDLVSQPYHPDPDHCCEACVFGRGPHADWCHALATWEGEGGAPAAHHGWMEAVVPFTAQELADATALRTAISARLDSGTLAPVHELCAAMGYMNLAVREGFGQAVRAMGHRAAEDRDFRAKYFDKARELELL